MAKGGEFILPDNNFSGVFTVNNFTEEQQMVSDTVREFVANEIATDEAIKRIESKDLDFSRQLLKKAGELGLLGAEIPEEYGGQGLDKVTGAIIAEEMAHQASFATTFLAHTGIGTLPIRFFGTEEQKRRYLPKLTSGQWVAAYCLTEAGAGSDAGSVKSSAKRVLDSSFAFELNGEKIFVTNGGFADLYIVFAQLEGYGLTAFIVEKDWLSIGKEEHKVGIQGSSTSTIILSNARVPERCLLGEPGKGFKIAMNILNLGRFKLAAASLGGGRQAFKEALEYSKNRKQFGQPICNFGAIREKLARMAAKNYAMEAVVYRTAGHLEESIGQVDASDPKAVLEAIGEFVVECSLVKVFCSESLDYIVDENVQVHGGSGFCEELPAARHYRDSRINRIFEGTNEVNRMLAVGELLKKALNGGLPLLAVGKNLAEEIMSPSAMTMEPDDFTEKLTLWLNNAKKAVILASGAAVQKFGMKLKEHQMVLMNLADCLIAIYVMESVLAAFAGNPNEKDADLTALVFDENLFETERLVRKLVAMCSEGDTQRTMNAAVKRLLKFTPANTEDLSNKIVESLI